MGYTYHICYCKDGYKCKGKASEVDKFDEKHWSEVRTNLEIYLKEPVCVPGATGGEPALSSVDLAVNDYMRCIAESRANHFSGDYALWHRRRVDTAHAVTRLSAIPLEILSNVGTTTQDSWSVSRFASVDIDDTTRRIMEIAVLLSESYRRAATELSLAVQHKEEVYTFHHFALLVDIVAEMQALAIQATAHISTEKLLPTEHPYRVVVERRQHEVSTKSE